MERFLLFCFDFFETKFKMKQSKKSPSTSRPTIFAAKKLPSTSHPTIFNNSPLVVFVLLLFVIGTGLLFFQYSGGNTATPTTTEVNEIKIEIAELPNVKVHQAYNQTTYQKRLRNSYTKMIGNYSNTKHHCYEWLPKSNGYYKRGILPKTPIFNQEKGLLEGEYGGPHVKQDSLIPPFDSALFQKSYLGPMEDNKRNWSFPATEGQDVLVIKLLNGKTNGIFVDIGARYWHKGSNSFALEYYYHWRGLCVEPDSHFFQGLTLNRSCTVICNNPIDNVASKSVYFNYQVGGGAAGVNLGNDVGEKFTTTVPDILTHFLPISSPTTLHLIDYLSIDIEGFEFQAIEQIDFEHYRFSIISVERPSLSFHHLLTKHGYWWLTHLPGNFGENMYIHESLPGFIVVMNSYRPQARANWRTQEAKYLTIPAWSVVNSTINTAA